MAERRYRMLGGLHVEVDGEPVDLGTHKQRALLAVLLLAEGRAVDSDTLVDRIWGESAPDRVGVSLQSYVSALRRVLEPDRPPRGAPTALVTRGTAYALLAERDHVDVHRFADLVAAGRAAARGGELREAADLLHEALGLYGPLLPELAGEPFRTAAAEHLEQLHVSALELSYEVRLGLGEHQLLIPDLESAVRRHPLHEGLWGLLAIARYRIGRQSDALQAVADCKRLLAEEIGVDPGPRLRQLEADLLAQAPHLDAPSPPEELVTPGGTPGERPPVRLIGRTDEVEVLRAAVADAVGGRDRVVVLEGEPGAGKTRLLEEVAGRGHRSAGVLAVWGRCVEGGGAPALWPWLQVLADALTHADEAARERIVDAELGWLLDPESHAARPSVLPDAGARFRLFDQAAELLAGIARAQPLVIVLDDVQWADQASLDLLVHVASARLPGVVLLVAVRDRAPVPSAALSVALGALAGLASHRRLVIGALGEEEVAALIEQQTGDRPAAAVIESIHRRTEGNPFFVRELARLLQDEGGLDEAAVAAGAVPAGIRDVVRGRVEAAGPEARRLLELAAVIGRDIDLDLLARAAGASVDDVLSRLETAVDLGLLGPHPEAPFAFRFSHDLVRESIAESVPAYQAIRLHLAVADALEGSRLRRADSAERLAHHLWSAGPLATPARSGAALLEAGRLALQRYSYDAARRHLELAAVVAQSGDEPELELEVIALLTSAVGVQQGYVGSTLDLLERAEELATELGRPRRAADFLYTRWAAHSQGLGLTEAERLAERLYRQGLDSDDLLVKVYGHHAKGVDAWDHGRIGEAHRLLVEAEALLARQLAEGSVEEDLLRYDLTLLVPAFLGFMTVFVGDVDGGRRRFDEMAASMGSGPYPAVVWSAFAGIAAAFAGDADWARAAADRGVAADPQFDFVFLGTYVRIISGWARAVQGEDPAAAVEEIQSLLDSMPREQPLSGEGAWWTLFADACLTAGQPERALAALERGANAMAGHGQVYPEPLRLLVLARHQSLVGRPSDVVRATLDAVRADASARGALLLVERARRAEEELAGGVAQPPSTRSR
jgi:DNA-binding SARP family transcriptional activator